MSTSYKLDDFLDALGDLSEETDKKEILLTYVYQLQREMGKVVCANKFLSDELRRLRENHTDLGA